MMKNLPDPQAVERDTKAGRQKQGRSLLHWTSMVLMAISCGLISDPTLSAPIPTATVTSAPGATETALPTATSVAPSVLVSAAVPCFTGPGEIYELVVDLQAGETAMIVGRSEGFWAVMTANGSECWVSEASVTPQGDVAAIPSVDPPPTPAPVAPAAPTSLQVIAARCTVDRSVRPIKYVNQFHLAWTDIANNEDGFHLYRDGTRVAELAANRTDVIDEIVAQNNRPHFYYVIAYNAVGESKSDVITLTCDGAGEGGGGGGGGPGPGPGGP